ncbi:MAG: type II toxin-antitoxin system VapC family toxin [Chloroflexota bacterium]
MRFWDASAVVPLILGEPATNDMLELRRQDPEIAVWWGTRVECASALSRRSREASPEVDQWVQAKQRLMIVFTGFMEIAPTDEVRTRAERLLTIHPLRAADALQLAAALLWASERPTGAYFVSLDNRLQAAARHEGFEVLPNSDST